MLALSYIFYVLSKCYLIPFLKLNIMIIFEVLYSILYKFVKTKHSYKKSKEKKLAVITGGSKGIGMEVVRKLIDLNYDVVLLSRDTAAMSQIQKKYNESRVKYSYLDLSDLKSIAVTINSLKLENVDLLINNARVYFRDVKRRDNVELNMLVNFVAHYLVTEYIDAKRVVNVSSSVVYSIKSIKERGYAMFMENYAQSKLANLQHTFYLKQKGVNCVAVHPGIVASGLFDNTLYGKFVGLLYIVMPFLFTSVNDAADNVLYACFVEDISDDKNVVDFYMYGQKAMVPDYVNNSNMLKLMEYAHNTIDSVIAKDK